MRAKLGYIMPDLSAQQNITLLQMPAVYDNTDYFGGYDPGQVLPDIPVLADPIPIEELPVLDSGTSPIIQTVTTSPAVVMDPAVTDLPVVPDDSENSNWLWWLLIAAGFIYGFQKRRSKS